MLWGISGSGSPAVAANEPHTLEPGIFFGKGFGDLPPNLAWLRPFAITGAVSLQHPLASTSTNLEFDPQSNQLTPSLTPAIDTLHWGFSIQYSTYYLSNRYTPGKLPKDEDAPLRQFIPLVEFAFDSARSEKTAATMNPGVAYLGNSWELAAEAIIPLNGEGGHGVGVRAGLFLFLEDLIPAIFGKPLLSAYEHDSHEHEGHQHDSHN